MFNNPVLQTGDQVLEWDGCSLQDATFEEARDIMSRSGDTVQLLLTHGRSVTVVNTQPIFANASK